MELLHVSNVLLGVAVACLFWVTALDRLNLHAVMDQERTVSAGLFLFVSVSVFSVGALFVVSHITSDWSPWINLPVLALILWKLTVRENRN